MLSAVSDSLAHPSAFLIGIGVPSIDFAGLSAEECMAVLGNNSGNLAFNYAVHHQLGGSLPRVPRSAMARDISAKGDIGVVPMANHLGPHVDLAREAEKYESVTSSLVGIGLGAQGRADGVLVDVPAGSQRWLRAFLDHAPSGQPNVSLRGEYTRRVIERYGLDRRCCVLGCPTLFIHPSPTLGALLERRYQLPIRRVAVAAGNPRWTGMSGLERSLVMLARATDGEYITQSPREFVELGRGRARQLPSGTLAACRDYIAPDMGEDEFVDWTRRRASAYFSVEAWMAALQGHDFVVGARFHGVMLAIQAGVPALCIAHDSRTRELCETSCIPFIMARSVHDGLKIDDLRRLVAFDGSVFDRRRSDLARDYREFLRNNGLRPAGQWMALADTVA